MASPFEDLFSASAQPLHVGGRRIEFVNDPANKTWRGLVDGVETLTFPYETVLSWKPHEFNQQAARAVRLVLGAAGVAAPMTPQKALGMNPQTAADMAHWAAQKAAPPTEPITTAKMLELMEQMKLVPTPPPQMLFGAPVVELGGKKYQVGVDLGSPEYVMGGGPAPVAKKWQASPWSNDDDKFVDSLYANSTPPKTLNPTTSETKAALHAARQRLIFLTGSTQIVKGTKTPEEEPDALHLLKDLNGQIELRYEIHLNNVVAAHRGLSISLLRPPTEGGFLVHRPFEAVERPSDKSCIVRWSDGRPGWMQGCRVSVVLDYLSSPTASQSAKIVFPDGKEERQFVARYDSPLIVGQSGAPFSQLEEYPAVLFSDRSAVKPAEPQRQRRGRREVDF